MTINSKNEQQILALASIFQACRLVYELASNGFCDETIFHTQLNSLYTLEAPNFQAIYGSPDNLKLGLKTLAELLSKKTKDRTDALISRYALDIIFLQYRLMKKQDVLDYIRRRIKFASQQKIYFNAINDTIINNLADIYSHSISQFNYKIQLIGKPDYLRNPKIFSQIRALLLSGIRASVLWQQLGGRRHHLFFTRNRLLLQSRQILEKIEL